MLFSGFLGCFSPSVDAAIRKLWVKNGGRLTHTDDDFRKATFFFCVGMNDPWLSQLLSRSLIVRHASWVTLCVVEDFVMPLAPYTLDNGFKESKIKVLNPRLPEENYDQIPLNTRKRRLFDHAAEGENQRKENENRPPKKTRFDIKERTVAWVDSASASKPSVTDSDPVKPAHTTATSVHGPLIDLTRIQASTKNAALSSRKFESQIQITTLSPPPTPPKPAKTLERSTRLHPNVVYWNELLAKSCAQNTASLKLDIADILRAPAAEAAIFRVDESYCGHKFINKDYQ